MRTYHSLLSVSQKRAKERHTFTIGLHPNDVWSGSYFTKMMKELAVRCGFDNPTRCTGQGKRSEGISRMVNSKEDIPLCESMRAARHAAVEAHLGYAEPDEAAHSKRYRAMASKTVTDVKVGGEITSGLSDVENIGIPKLEASGGLSDNSGMGMANMGGVTNMGGMPNMAQPMMNMPNMAQPMMGYNPYCGMTCNTHSM